MNTHVKAHHQAPGLADAGVLARAVGFYKASALAGEFCYMPAGENRITATVNGQAEEITVMVDEATATALQADLTARFNEGPKPTLDYNHEGGKASGWPSAFKWVPAIGVVCEVEWTISAREAIRAGEWRYFSPEFRYDRLARRVSGLRPTGPLGGLVNDPAFRAMPAVQARHATNPLPADPPESPPPPTPTMNEKAIVAALAAAGILSITEAAGDNAAALVTARIADLKAGESVKAAHASALTGKDAEITALKAEITASKEKEATAAVDAAVKAGRIAPKDEATQTFWKGSILAQGEAAVTALNKVPVQSALRPTNVGSTEAAPDGEDKDKAFYEAVSARARVIEKTTGVTFNNAFAAAEAEIKATQS